MVHTAKPVKNGHSKIDKTKVLTTNGSIMKVESMQNATFIKLPVVVKTVVLSIFDLH